MTREIAVGLSAPHDLVQWVAENERPPVVHYAVVPFTAGGIDTPADAALMMQLGADGVFVWRGTFKSGDPASRARHRKGHDALPRAKGRRGGQPGAWRGDGG